MLLATVLALVAIVVFNKLKTYGSRQQFYTTSDYSWVKIALAVYERYMLIALVPVLPLLITSTWRLYEDPYKGTVGIGVSVLAYIASVLILRKIGD